MNVTGSCHCGEISYEAVVDPEKVGICHCSDCQSFSASAFHVVAMVAGATFRFTRGEPRIYMKTAESGNRRRLAFCATCSSSIYSCEDSDTPQFYNIRTGTLHQRQEIVPRFECWRGSALGWVEAGSDRKLFDKNPG